MKNKIIIGAIFSAILLLSIPSITAVQHGTIVKQTNQNEIKNIWLKILLYTVFAGSMTLLALLFGKRT